MKKEKGSALLTVVLIASVTATIGVAISSFILMNYRLRLYDTYVRRAEYAAEEIIDKTYLYVQEYCYNKFSDMANDAYEEAIEEYQDEKSMGKSEPLYSTIDENGEYTPNENAIKNNAMGKYDNEFNVLYTKFDEKIEELLNGKNINNDEKIEIDVISCVSGENKFTQPLKISYKIPKNAVIKSNPIVKFSVDIIIAKPGYEDVINTRYDIREYVGISNWSIDNNWNI